MEDSRRHRLLGQRRTFYVRNAARAEAFRCCAGGFLRLGPLRRLRQRNRPVLRRGAVVGIPGTGIALRRFLDREMAQDQPLQGYGVPKQRSLPGRLHFVSGGGGVPTVSLRLRRNGIRGSRPEIRHRLVLSGRADRRIAAGVGCVRCSRYRAAHLQRAPTRKTRQGSRAAHHGLLFRQTGIFL